MDGKTQETGEFMDREAIERIALEALKKVAPEADCEGLDPEKRFRDQFEFDSVDFLNFINALQEKLKVEVPEIDYPKLATLRGCVDYLTPIMPNA
jgi:acyl carrier protein